ncbi:MAG: type II toxin-antitoxin system VapC family toxin [Patescibacteria group bacterium]
MKKYVLDASIILVSLLESRKGVLDKINTYLFDIQKVKLKALSVDFLKTEVANGLRFGLSDPEKATKFFNSFLSLPIKYEKLDTPLYEEAIYLAFKYKTTIYDTLYHVLAKAQNAVFLTCDEDYYKKAKDLGDIELIK